jgi:transposase
MTGLDSRRLVFIDETWAATKMSRRYGRSRRGQRLIAKVPHGHWKTTTFVAALRHDGLTAPTVVDGAMNGPVFLAYVQQQLVTTLLLGDIVVMGNLSAHKVAGVREVITSAGAKVVYLPPYSPDLNPIELVFSKLKWLARSAAERTIDGLWSFLAMSWSTSQLTNAAATFKTRLRYILMKTGQRLPSVPIEFEFGSSFRHSLSKHREGSAQEEGLVR